MAIYSNNGPAGKRGSFKLTTEKGQECGERNTQDKQRVERAELGGTKAEKGLLIGQLLGQDVDVKSNLSYNACLMPMVLTS